MNIQEQEKALNDLLARLMDAPLRPILQHASQSLETASKTNRDLRAAQETLLALQVDLAEQGKALRHLKKWQSHFDEELPQPLQDAFTAQQAQATTLQANLVELSQRVERDEAAAQEARAAAQAQLEAVKSALSTSLYNHASAHHAQAQQQHLDLTHALQALQVALLAAVQQNAQTQRADAQQQQLSLSQSLQSLQSNSQQAHAATEAALGGQLQAQSKVLHDTLQQVASRQSEAHSTLLAELAVQKTRVQWAVGLSGVSLLTCAGAIAAWALKLV